MLGSMLTKEEVDEFMAEADVVMIMIFLFSQSIFVTHRMGMGNWTMMSLSR